MLTIPGKHFAKNLVERRALLYELVRRDFQQRFVGSAAGWLWGVIHPLVLLTSWTFVFQVCLRAPLPADAITHQIDVSAFLDQKKRSMQAHASQSTSSTDGPRSIALFLSLPDEYFALAFGTEWFVERGRPTEPQAHELFPAAES